ncbi:MAG: hypothetical protein ABIH27_03780 [Candidatus Omnitrophota bacterium]
MFKVLLVLALVFSFQIAAYAAPCYGTNMPKKKQFFAGLQTHSIFKRTLENEAGKIRSLQNFLLISYGVFDWLAIDLKVGAGNLKQHPVGNDEMDYQTGFAGGYGFRLKAYDKDNLKMIFGFQHISVHPYSIHLGDTRHKAILDDWQFSFLASRDIFKVTPYLGLRWSRVDYIHKIEGERKRVMSDLTKDIGLIYGLDIPITKKTWINLEGQVFDSYALACSINYKF